MKDHYYEIGINGEIIAFDDFDDATAYADAHGATLICEIGGSWDDFAKCWWCDNWVPVSDMNKNSLCSHCESYLMSRGEI